MPGQGIRGKPRWLAISSLSSLSCEAATTRPRYRVSRGVGLNFSATASRHGEPNEAVSSPDAAIALCQPVQAASGSPARASYEAAAPEALGPGNSATLDRYLPKQVAEGLAARPTNGENLLYRAGIVFAIRNPIRVVAGQGTGQTLVRNAAPVLWRFRSDFENQKYSNLSVSARFCELHN